MKGDMKGCITVSLLMKLFFWLEALLDIDSGQEVLILTLKERFCILQHRGCQSVRNLSNCEESEIVWNVWDSFDLGNLGFVSSFFLFNFNNGAGLTTKLVEWYSSFNDYSRGNKERRGGSLKFYPSSKKWHKNFCHILINNNVGNTRVFPQT